jgi:hypothetical protein
VSGSPITIFRSSVLVVAWLGLEDVARFDSKFALVHAHVFRFRGICKVFCAFGGFGSVLVFGAIFSLSAIIRVFLHPLSWLSCCTRASGGSRSASLRICVLPISVHPVDSFRVENCCVLLSRISDF